MRKIIPLLLLLTLCSCSFFPHSYEIENLAVIEALGIDINENGDLTLIAVSRKGRLSEGSDANSNDTVLFTATGRTINSCLYTLQHLSDKNVFLSHAQYYIISEAAASSNLFDILDFLARDNYSRLSTAVFICRDSTAANLIAKCSNSFIADRLEKLTQERNILFSAISASMYDTLAQLDRTGIAVIPVLAADSYSDTDYITLDGCAVIRDGEFCGLLDQRTSNSLNFLKNEIYSESITIDYKGVTVAVNLTSANRTYDFKVSGNIPTSAHISVSVTATIDEFRDNDIVINEQTLDGLSDALNDEIYNRLSSAILKAQEMNIDFLNVGTYFELSYPVHFSEIKDWNKIFSTLPISLDVDTNISSSYDLNQPVKVTK